MVNIPVLRWGKPYESMTVDDVIHFQTGEVLAKVGQANGSMVQLDLKKAQKARDVLRQLNPADLIEKVKKAADLYLNGTLPLGDGQQSPADFYRMQSATTGLPEHMCKANMSKNHFVLTNMDKMLDALTRGLDPHILSRGYGLENRGVVVSYQAQSPVLGLVLPSNSPGVHTLWLSVIPMQIGLVLKPGPQEPWTPYRMFSAFVQAGIPAEAMSIYPGGAEVGAAVLNGCRRCMIFGSTQTVNNYKGNANVQVHGPGFSKIVLGDDMVDRWEEYIDIMADSIYLNSGRGCINCSGVWASRHTKEIAQALAEKLGPIPVKPPDDPTAGLAAFTIPGQAEGVWNMIEEDLKEPGVEHMTAKFGPRFEQKERSGYLRPTIIHCEAPEAKIASKEFMFPFATVVKCPQDQFLAKMGGTLVCSLISENQQLINAFSDNVHIDRLNIGPLPTIKLDWLQPHEGNIVEFLFRARAFQVTGQRQAELQASTCG